MHDHLIYIYTLIKNRKKNYINVDELYKQPFLLNINSDYKVNKSINLSGRKQKL